MQHSKHKNLQTIYLVHIKIRETVIGKGINQGLTTNINDTDKNTDKIVQLFVLKSIMFIEKYFFSKPTRDWLTDFEQKFC